MTYRNSIYSINNAFLHSAHHDFAHHDLCISFCSFYPVISDHCKHQCSVSIILSNLKWELLTSRWRKSPVSLICKVVNGLIVIPVYRLHHSQCFARRSEDLNYHFTEFHSKSHTFNQTIWDWNDLLHNVIKANYRGF